MRRAVLKLLVMGVGFSCCMSSEAGVFDRLMFFRNWSAKNRVETLIVTGNYAESRLLAELIQKHSKQPILLVSPSATGGTELFFMPSAPEAMTVEQGKYVEFVDFLQPKRIVFLGDDRYTPQVYMDLLRDRYPTLVVTSNDWQKNAEAAAALFDSNRLPKDYADCLGRLMRAAEGRPAAWDSVPGSASPAEPLVAPLSVVPAGG